MPEPRYYDCTACNEPHDERTWHTLGMVCARCNQHTGNNTQGHHWGLCKVLLARGVPWQEAIVESHFCCPGDCQRDGAA